MNHAVSESARKRIAEARKKPISVNNLLTGEKMVYDSISSFAKEMNVTQSALSRVVKNKKPYRNTYLIEVI